jgi:predicted lipid-binding transport protein (Tim44 family)
MTAGKWKAARRRSSTSGGRGPVGSSKCAASCTEPLAGASGIAEAAAAAAAAAAAGVDDAEAVAAAFPEGAPAALPPAVVAAFEADDAEELTGCAAADEAKDKLVEKAGATVAYAVDTVDL